MKKTEESDLQIACVSWFRLQYPHLANLLWAIPNGGARDAKTGYWLKREGVLAGASDLVLFVPRPKYASLHIEMKSGKGRQTPEQKRMQLYLQQYGNKYIVCKTFDDFRSEIESYLN